MGGYPFFNMRKTILFMEHDLDKAVNLKSILSAFEQLSGLKINFHKSELFCFGDAQDAATQYALLEKQSLPSVSGFAVSLFMGLTA